MKNKNLSKFLAVAASISIATTPISALATETNTPPAESDTHIADSKLKLDLANEIETVEVFLDDLKEENFSPASWAAVTDAVKNAKELLTKEEIHRVDVFEAIDKLQEAAKNLTVDKTDLEAEIENLTEFLGDGEKFTPASVAPALEALNKAKEVAASETATQAEINEAIEQLLTAAQGVTLKESKHGDGTTTDKPEFDLSQIETPKTDEEKPAEDKKDEEKPAEGKKDETKPAQEIKKPEVNKEKLQDLYNKHRKLAENAPTGDETLRQETYKPFVENAKKAKAVLDDKNATQADVDSALSWLEYSYKNLDQNIYRIYNPNNGEHLFTSNEHEYNELGKLGWEKEGIAWIAPKSDLGIALTRLYDANSGEHHYTKNPEEIRALQALGWTNEGKKWASAEENYHIIHRLYNPNETRAGRHHYTVSDNEKNVLDVIGWNWEREPGDLIYAKSPFYR